MSLSFASWLVASATGKAALGSMGALQMPAPEDAVVVRDLASVHAELPRGGCEEGPERPRVIMHAYTPLSARTGTPARFCKRGRDAGRRP